MILENDNETLKSLYYHAKMITIEKGKQQGLDTSKYDDIDKYDYNQMEQIRIGLKLKLDVDLYRDPKNHWEDMRRMMLGQLYDIEYKDHKYFQQLELIGYAKEKGYDISLICNPKLSISQISLLIDGLENNVDISKYNDPSKFNYDQMQIIQTAMIESKIDLLKYYTPGDDHVDLRNKYYTLIGREIKPLSKEVIAVLKNQLLYKERTINNISIDKPINRYIIDESNDDNVVVDKPDDIINEKSIDLGNDSMSYLERLDYIISKNNL